MSIFKIYILAIVLSSFTDMIHTQDANIFQRKITQKSLVDALEKCHLDSVKVRLIKALEECKPAEASLEEVGATMLTEAMSTSNLSALEAILDAAPCLTEQLLTPAEAARVNFSHELAAVLDKTFAEFHKNMEIHKETSNWLDRTIISSVQDNMTATQTKYKQFLQNYAHGLKIATISSEEYSSPAGLCWSTDKNIRHKIILSRFNGTHEELAAVYNLRIVHAFDISDAYFYRCMQEKAARNKANEVAIKKCSDKLLASDKLMGFKKASIN